jgi:DNA polymerase-3 subunit delta'
VSAVWLRPLPWQQDLWLELTSQVLQGRLPHAVLLAGPEGVGKRWFARALIAFVLCESRSGYACGQCRSCVQLAVGAHPDALLLSTDGLLGLALTGDGRHEQGLAHWQPDDSRNEGRKRRDIAIDAARKLIERLSLSAHYGKARAALIEPADALNTNSVNALLKTIEEPPPATHLLLVSERPQSLPATLRSRCQRIRLGTPRADEAGDWLEAQLGRRETDALAAAHGAPLRALSLADSDELAEQRAWGELWLAVGRRRKDPVTAAASVDRDTVAAHLRWAYGWLHSQFRDRVEQPGTVSGEPQAWAQMLDEVIEANRLAVGNAQMQLVLESLFVQWLRIGPRALGEG